MTFDWRLGLFLIVLFGAVRFCIVLDASRTGNYQFVSLIFIAMIVLPFLLLNKEGQREIGWRRPLRMHWILLTFFLGILASLLVYWMGRMFYANTFHNWYVAIGKSYPVDLGHISGAKKAMTFFIFAFISMSFSPIGEELLYRGLVHNSFEIK